MSIELWLLIVVLIVLIVVAGYIFSIERERRRKQELWENEVYDLVDRLQKKVDLMSGQLLSKLSEETQRLDENTQKRHNYLKKSYNDIADRLDLLENTDKKVKDLYYQYERIHTTLSELVALQPKSNIGEAQKSEEAEFTPSPPPLDEEVVKVLQLYKAGMTVEEIAQQLGRAIPEIQLTLHIFADHVK